MKWSPQARISSSRRITMGAMGLVLQKISAAMQNALWTSLTSRIGLQTLRIWTLSKMYSVSWSPVSSCIDQQRLNSSAKLSRTSGWPLIKRKLINTSWVGLGVLTGARVVKRVRTAVFVLAFSNALTERDYQLCGRLSQCQISWKSSKFVCKKGGSGGDTTALAHTG